MGNLPKKKLADRKGAQKKEYDVGLCGDSRSPELYFSKKLCKLPKGEGGFGGLLSLQNISCYVRVPRHPSPRRGEVAGLKGKRRSGRKKSRGLQQGGGKSSVISKRKNLRVPGQGGLK